MFDLFCNNLASEMTDEAVHEFISANDKIFFEEIDKTIDSVKDGLDKEALFDTIRQQCKNERFCSIVINIITKQIIPYEDMEYFRSLDYETFKEKIEYLFKNTILQSELDEVVKAETALSDEEVDRSMKLLNTVTDWVIIKRFTVKRFCYEVYELFRFDNLKAEYLFNLYSNNAQSLTNIALFANIDLCKDLKNDMDKILDIFNNIFDNDESDEK